MKEQILKLRSEGKTYREIQKIVKCSRGLLSYYINPTGKSKTLDRQNKNRLRKKVEYRSLLGGKCQLCGYNKCISALHFHHKNPKEKLFEISSALWGNVQVTEQEILDEIKKCELLCANCHIELHYNNY